MSFQYMPMPLFSEEDYKHCIIVPFPEGGEIVELMVLDKTAFIMIESHPNAKLTTAHFHIVPAMQKLYADGHKYIGTVKIENFQGKPITMHTVIQITAGDFGVFSQEFVDIHGTEERDRIIAEHQGEIKSAQVEEEQPESHPEDDNLRALWDFTSYSGPDKTDGIDKTDEESETE